MDQGLATALLLAVLAGAAIPLGALLAMVERIRPDWLEQEFRHSVVAFGGGALFSAIALVLVPEGMARLPGWPALALFIAGGLVFFALDRWLARHGGRAAQFTAMALDYIPEAMALGAVLAGDRAAALLMAGLIALQNLPEGFNAYRELNAATPGRNPRGILLFVVMVPLGPLAAWVGMVWLTDLPAILGGIMMFASGGILYLIFEDIAPQAVLERHWAPPLGAVAGFALGLAGSMMIG